MASMAFLILRAAARIPSSAAMAACRFAALTRAAAAAAAVEARSGSGGAAIAAGPRLPRSKLSHESESIIPNIHPYINGKRVFRPDWEKFEATEKDLVSDDALWKLYERWCKVFKQKRDREEMARRFSIFKDTVLRVEENKKSDLPYRLGINQFADGKLIELYRRSSTMNHVRRPFRFTDLWEKWLRLGLTPRCMQSPVQPPAG